MLKVIFFLNEIVVLNYLTESTEIILEIFIEGCIRIVLDDHKYYRGHMYAIIPLYFE